MTKDKTDPINDNGDDGDDFEVALGNENTSSSSIDGESKREATDWSSRVEAHPWQGFSYMLSVLQFMLITLDLFMDTSVAPGWHYSITSIEFVGAIYLAGYQFIRLVALIVSVKKATDSLCSVCCGSGAFWLLVISFWAQCVVIGCSAYSFTENSDPAEWTMYGLGIVWATLNPLTFASVNELKQGLQEQRQKRDAKEIGMEQGEAITPQKKKKMGPFQAACSIFRHHFVKTPLLSFLGIVFASGHAILSTYQGAIINELTKAVTKTDENGQLKASAQDVKRLAQALLAVWASSIAAKFIFDIVSSLMFARLELWLRRVVFDKAVEQSCTTTGANMAKYQTNYASDISGTVGLYNSLLNGVVVNILMIITAFIFLAFLEWKIACVTLGFLAMAVTSGPTSLAGDSAANTQHYVTEGISLLGECTAGSKANPDMEPLIKRHEDEVLGPMRGSLFGRTFYTNSVATFITFSSTFLTAIVVITMSWEVFNGDLDSSDFLGIFFIFKQLQKPATKLSGVIKKLVKQTASLQRVNDVVLPPK